MKAYAWPGGIYEAVFSPGVLPAPQETVFPFTVNQLTLPDGCIATLYYENGLRVAVEQGQRLRCGAMLGEEHTGRLQLLHNGMLCVVAGKPNSARRRAAREVWGDMLVLDKDYHEALRISAATPWVWKTKPPCDLQRLPTLLWHEAQQV